MIFAPTDSQKVFSHTERIATWLREERSYPITFEIDATNACNHACSFCCWSVLHEKHKDTMSSELLTKIVGNLASVGVKGLIWTGGGEPLLNQHTPAAIELARSAGLKNGLFTNGVLITEEMARSLVHSCEWIRFSIAAGTRSDYHRIQGVDDFELVKRNIAMVVDIARQEESSVRLGATMLLHKSSVDTFVPFVQMCRNLGLSYAQGKPNNNYDHEDRSSFIQVRNVKLRNRAGHTDAEAVDHSTDYDAQWWTEVALPVLEKAGGFATPTFRVVTSQYAETKYDDPAEEDDAPHDCSVNNFVAAVTASADVVWCKNYRDRPEYVIGNLREQTLEEIWQSERRAEVQARIDTRKCSQFCQNKKLVRLLRSIRNPDRTLNPDFL